MFAPILIPPKPSVSSLQQQAAVGPSGTASPSGSSSNVAGLPASLQSLASGGAGLHQSSNTSAAAIANNPSLVIPRRRVSYLIPPPPAEQPPPLLALPTGTPTELRNRKRGNPNPLIILSDNTTTTPGDNSSNVGIPNDLYAVSASTDSRNNAHIRGNNSYTRDSNHNYTGSITLNRDGQKSILSTSLTSPSSSRAAAGSSSQPYHYHSNNTAVQRHPEHTLGITAFALDTSTVIDNSSSPSKKKTPGGILYSGGRDGLVASWELGLPFKQRDAAAATAGSTNSYIGKYSKNRRKRYLPRWAEDSYEDRDILAEDGEDDESSSDEEANNEYGQRTNPGLRLDGRKLQKVVSTDGYDENDAEELLLPDDDAPEENVSQSYSSNKLRLDTSFNQGYSSMGSGLQLDLNRRKDQRRRSTSSSAKRFSLNGSGNKAGQNPWPYEQRWCIDHEQIEAKTYRPRPTTFRQAHRGHTNWVNDIVLCNLNQTVVSASSDRMIRAWNPHDPHRSMLPAALGSHHDYVRCLSYARDSGWIASGGFDRKIKIWDVMESRHDPISEYEMSGSVYALASNPSGSTIVAGSPEKVVRLYDPRAARGANPVAGLVGHADNVRALLVSEDGRHVLSASSDSTVKMWSVSMRRCLHTFTHHSDSVWSLFSSHPHLEIFYSGDRAGALCKVDFENAGDIASDGECVILLRNRDNSKPGKDPSPNDGIHRIVATDDAYLWTASASSNICRWKDIPSKAKRKALARPTVPHRQSSIKHYSTSIPEQTENIPGNANDTTSPIAIKGTGSDEMASGNTRLNRARSNSSMSRERPSGSQFSVAFAPGPLQKSSPQSGSPLSSSMQFQQQQRPSSLRFSTASRQTPGSATYSSSPTANQLSPILSPTRSIGDDQYATALTTPTSAAIDTSVPSLNGIPLESLVPLFTLDDPYARSSGYAAGSAVGYSASVLSLHKTTSRGLGVTASSPFGVSNFPTPPSSGLSMPRAPLGYNARSASPMPNALLGGAYSSYHRPSSVLEEDEDNDDQAMTALQQPKPRNEAYIIAQQEFEDRETALDGVPVRSVPDDVVRGRSGLIRAELLNDRRTVISLDTEGEVAVWDIILGVCIGRFAKHELRRRPLSTASSSSSTSAGSASSKSSGSPYDVLEAVRLQIEGEAFVQSWCSVECRTGLLTVHIEQSRAFDAEVYLDEAGVPPRPEYRVDQRLNLGKWVLRNLFDGFLREALKAQTRRNRSGSVATSGSASIRSASSVEELVMGSKSGSVPGSIPFSQLSLQDSHDGSLYGADNRKWIEGASGLSAGFTTALATPAMTPAVLPDQSDVASQLASPRLLPSTLNPLAQLSPIPQSPSGATTAPATPLSSAQRSEGDYFSRPRTTQSIPDQAANTSALPTPKPSTLSSGQPATPLSGSPAAKMSKMSRFKSFGKKETPSKKEGAPEVPALTGVPPTPTDKPQEPTGTEEEEREKHLTTVQKAQQAMLRAVFSHTLQPPQWHETPHIRYSNDLPLMIEEESHDAGAWATVYRNVMSNLPADVAAFETTIPPWLLEFLCHGVSAHKDPVKIAFILEPHGGPESAGLDALPSGNARLSATRMLRMRKACHYVAEKLELESWKQRLHYQATLDARTNNAGNASGMPAGLARSATKTSLSSSSSSYTHLQNAAGDDIEEPTLLPEDEVEILCNDQVVPLNITLAACAKYCYGKGGDVYLTYRKRELDITL